MKRFISLILVLFAVFSAAALTQEEMSVKPYTDEVNEHFEIVQRADYFIRLGLQGTNWVVDVSPNKKFNGDVYRTVYTNLNTAGHVKDLTEIYNGFKKSISLENVILILESRMSDDPAISFKFEGKTTWCKNLHVYCINTNFNH